MAHIGGQNGSRRLQGHRIDLLDAMFSELSRAAGPMFLLFSIAAVAWFLLHTF